MTDITEFIDENDLTAADVIDALDIDPAQFADVPDEPTDFYDGQPSVDDLEDDFDAVSILADEKEDLEDEVSNLNDELNEYKRTEFEAKADELTDLTDKWEKESMLECFEDGDLIVDDLDDRVELVKDIKGSDTTTVTDSNESEETETGDGPDFDTTSTGKFDLRDRTKVE